MFEIRCIVADKKVVDVLHLLDGHTLEPPVALPIRGAAPASKQLNGASHHDMPHSPPQGQGSTDLLRKYIAGRKGAISTKELRDYLMNKGYSPNGYSYALQQLLKDGSLKKTKEYAVYEVAH